MADTFPQMHDVKSSNLHSVGHDGASLLVRFRDAKGGPGKLWRFNGVDAQHVDGIKSADSPGKYFYRTIRANHTGIPVQE